MGITKSALILGTKLPAVRHVLGVHLYLRVMYVVDQGLGVAGYVQTICEQ